MSEALRAVLSFGFESLGIGLIGAYCEILNSASAHVMERAGMRVVARRGHVLHFLASRYHTSLSDRAGDVGDRVDETAVAA